MAWTAIGLPVVVFHRLYGVDSYMPNGRRLYGVDSYSLMVVYGRIDRSDKRKTKNSTRDIQHVTSRLCDEWT